jgi:hypothetical protein
LAPTGQLAKGVIWDRLEIAPAGSALAKVAKFGAANSGAYFNDQ